MLDSRRPRALDEFIALDTVLAGISHHRPEKLSSFGIGRLRASGWLAGIDKHNHAVVRREGDQPGRCMVAATFPTSTKRSAASVRLRDRPRQLSNQAVASERIWGEVGAWLTILRRASRFTFRRSAARRY